jgi:hypothetical protein
VDVSVAIQSYPNGPERSLCSRQIDGTGARSEFGAGADNQDLSPTVGQQLVWMREAGFIDVVCSYRNLIFAVLSGVKPR